MKCGDKEWQHCRVEKMGCYGCYYDEKGEKKKMKEMKYQLDRKIEMLDTGYCFGLLYYILNLGTHPVAYIKIPKEHILFNKDYDDIYEELDIDVHGGLTYSNDHLYISETQKIEGWFIGWDYAHYGDYAGYEEMFPENIRTGGKRWTTEEIFAEVKEACYQIQKMQKK